MTKRRLLQMLAAIPLFARFLPTKAQAEVMAIEDLLCENDGLRIDRGKIYIGDRVIGSDRVTFRSKKKAHIHDR